MAAAGWLIARSALALAAQTGMSDTAVGGVFTALATSLPELVTALAAVRQGALTLAVGNIVGGNVFDTLFVAVADVAYRGGSVLHAGDLSGVRLIIGAALLQSGLLLVALIRRQQSGLANVGIDSLVIPGIYLGLAALLVATAGGLLLVAAFQVVQRLLVGDVMGALLQMLERARLLLMLAEIIYTVRRVAQKQRMAAEPFFIVAIIAAIRRMLIITAESATHADMQDPTFPGAMVELGLLGFLILALARDMRLLRNGRSDELPSTR